MAKTVFDVLLNKLEERVRTVEESLADGGAKDFAEYQNLVGVIRGHRSSMQIISDLASNYVDDEDD